MDVQIGSLDPRSVFRRGLAYIWSYIRMHPLPFTIAVAGATVYALMTVATTVVPLR